MTASVDANFLAAPCEIAVKKYVPSIRASLATILVRDYGLSIYRTAKILQLTPAAVSNYLLKRRGSDYVDIILGDKELYGIISRIAEKLISDNIDMATMSAYICYVCRKLRERVEKVPPTHRPIVETLTGKKLSDVEREA